MPPLEKLPVRIRQIIPVAAAGTAALAVLAVSAFWLESATHREHARKEAAVWAEIVARTAAGAVRTGEGSGIQDLPRGLAGSAGSWRVEFLFGESRRRPPSLGWVQAAAPIMDGPARVGTVVVEFPARLPATQIAAWFGLTAIAVAGLWLAAVVMARRLERAISRPILRLIHTAEQISRNADYSLRMPPDDDPHVAGLIDAFNRMLAEIECRGRRLERQRQNLEAEVAERTRALVALNEKLLKDKARAEETAQQRARFLSELSHEARTPMTSIAGIAELMLATELTGEQSQSMIALRNSTVALMRVLNDVLDFSRIESGQVLPDPVEFSLRENIDDLARSLAIRAHEKSLEIMIDIADEVPDRYRGDIGRLRQALEGLLNQAIKRADHGEVLLRVVRGPANGPTITVRFLIGSPGSGPAPPRTDRPGQPERPEPDNGPAELTMALASQLAVLMGGELETCQEPDGVFQVFSVPLTLVDLDDLRNIGANPSSLEGKRALLVEDHRTNLGILARALESWGVTPAPAASAENAWIELSRNPAIDVVLLDADLPDQSGVDFARHLRSTRTYQATPLICFHKSPNSAEAELWKPLRVSRFLAKPVSTWELHRALVSALSARLPVTGSGRRMPPCPGGKLRILLAEDDLVNQRVIGHLLERRGYQVTAVRNGQQALDEWRRGPFDLVLMDVQMPVMDGFQATLAIRQEPGGESVPIVAITANALEGDRERCLAGGMDDYIPKPIDIELLNNTLERHLLNSAARFE